MLPATSGDMTMAAWADAPPGDPPDAGEISAAIFAAQALAAAEMSSAAYAALHPGIAAINATAAT